MGDPGCRGSPHLAVCSLQSTGAAIMGVIFSKCMFDRMTLHVIAGPAIFEIHNQAAGHEGPRLERVLQVIIL
jgi:hypothetical protein